MRPTKATSDTLNSLTELDVPFVVHPDGTVTDAPRSLYAPEVLGFDGHADIPDGWEALTGYSGQHGTGPGDPELHNSEYLGGGLARDVLATPGTYVCCPIFWPVADDDDDEDASEEEREDGGILEGWVVLRLTGSTIPERLEYLRGELRAERISYGELAELQGLTDHIEAGDLELLEAAGVPEDDPRVR